MTEGSPNGHTIESCGGVIIWDEVMRRQRVNELETVVSEKVSGMRRCVH